MSATPSAEVLRVRDFTGADEMTVSDDLIEDFISSAKDLIEEKTGKHFEADDPQLKIADEIAFNFACMKTLICMGIKESQGAIDERLGSDYTLRYPQGGPYAGQINMLKDAIKDGLDTLGYRLDYKII